MVSHATIFLTSIALVSASLVIRAQNSVHSVLFLIVVFCNASGLLVLLGLDFFAMILLVVYVGAIAVLFWATVRLLVFREFDTLLSKCVRPFHTASFELIHTSM
jgi:NADH:ubiquinone oxidoreductase subunit 6 (subunit J)